MTDVLHARSVGPSGFMPTQTSSVISRTVHPGKNKLTVAKFTSEYSKYFPMKFVVVKGYYGPNEDLKFSEGDKFRAHAVKQSTVINIEFDSGQRHNIPVTSTVPFAILFNPHDNLNEAIKGYRFEKVSELVQLSVLPLVLWSRKAYQGSNPDSSISANELLIVRRVKSRLVGKQQLKVYSLTQKKEKTLYTSCVGSFSTKPRDISLFLSDIIKYMPDIFPCRAVMFNPGGNGKCLFPGALTSRQDSCMVTMMHSSIETSLVISSALEETFQSSGTKYQDIPIDLGIMVRADTTTPDNKQEDAMYEDTSLYSHFDQAPPPGEEGLKRSQFYTNVHFGKEVSRGMLHPVPPQNFPSVNSAVEEGHYQTPKSVQTSSDPIVIESEYHPPDDVPPANYVRLTKEPDEGKRNSPGSGEAKDQTGSPSWRPPLPPPNKIQINHHQRSPGYSYVDTNPVRSTRLCNDGAVRSQAVGNGSILSTSNPESAQRERLSGSGGAVVDRRGSIGNKQVRLHGPFIGSGDGVVERSMRTSSISSAGYSYAKTEQQRQSCQQSSNPSLPTSPQHYSHLRSRSGPPALTQLPPLSSQVQRPVSTTRLDPGSDSLVVVQQQRQQGSAAHLSSTATRNIQRQESAPPMVGEATPGGGGGGGGPPSQNRPESLSTVMNDIEKMTQELNLYAEEENIFAQDNSPTSTEAPHEIPSPQQPQTLPPEIIEKHRSYLKTMDIYQIQRLLEMMGLEQYTPTFQQEQINGDILSTCDDLILKEELKITSRLHRMRLLRVIEGAYSIYEIMSGKDGYIFMRATGN